MPRFNFTTIQKLLAFKVLTQTIPSGIIVLTQPEKMVDMLACDDACDTPELVHMIVMWGIWQCFFQAPLELTFAFSRSVAGAPRNLFLFCENIFEIALLVDALVEPQFTPTVNLVLSVLTVVGMTLCLIFARDPVETKGKEDIEFALLPTTSAVAKVHQGRPVSAPSISSDSILLTVQTSEDSTPV